MGSEKQLITGISEDDAQVDQMMVDAEIAQRAATVPTPDSFLQAAIERGMEPEQLGKFIDLRNAEIERVARVEYHKNFAKLQGKLKPVKRTATVDNKYSYAPLEEIVKTIGSVVNAAGFSYRWSEEDLPIQVVEIEGKQRQLKKSKRYWFILSGFGHEERNYVDLPEGVDNPIANDAQKRGSSMSYGRRYSMIAGLGIVFEGEDDDGALSFSGDEVGEMAIQIAELKKASSLEELKQIYIPMAKAAKDEREKALLANIKNQVKAELQEIADAGN